MTGNDQRVAIITGGSQGTDTLVSNAAYSFPAVH